MKKIAATLIAFLSISAHTGLFSQTAAQAVAEATDPVYAKMEADLPTADSMAYALLETYNQDMASNDSVKAQLSFLMGTLELHKKRYRISYEYLEQALETELVRNKETARFKCLTNLAICQEQLGKVPEALGLYQQAVAVASSLKDQQAMADVSFNIGNLENEMGESDKAIALTSQALRSFEELADTLGVAVCHLNLGKFFTQKEDYEKGEWYTLKARELFEQLDNYSQLTSALINLARIEHLRKRHDRSNQLLQRVLDISRENHFDYNLAPTYTLLADNAITTGLDLAKAREYALEAIRLADTSGRRDVLEQGYLMLSRYYAKVNDFKNFDQALLDYDRARKETVALNARAAAEELNVIFNTKQLSSENRQLSRDVHLKNLQLLLLSLLLLLAIVTGSIIYRQHRRLQENLKTMFQMNLSLAYAGQGLQEELPDQEDVVPPTHAQQQETDQRLYRSIRNKIEQERLYLDPNLTIAEFARHFRLGSRRISTVIKEVGKTNFPGMVNELRVNEARRLLMEQGTSMSKAEIAAASGFSNSIYFNYCFKELTGFTPTDYLNMLQQQQEAPEGEADLE
jgi:AraC-like DNA-binding protein/tetratricopeptide (TPR) repeat protein